MRWKTAHNRRQHKRKMVRALWSFRKAANAWVAEQNGGFYADGEHWTAEGHRRFAHHIAEHFPKPCRLRVASVHRTTRNWPYPLVAELRGGV